MGKFKIVDKNDKHYLGRASANIEEIKNKFRNREEFRKKIFHHSQS